MKTLTKAALSAAAAFAAAAAIMTSLTAVASSSIQPLSGNTLTKVNGIWTNAADPIETYDMDTYSESFSLDYGIVTIGSLSCLSFLTNQFTQLTADDSYAGNYKYAGVTVRGKNGGSTKFTPESDRNKQTVSAMANDVGDVTSGKYYSFLYNGTGEGSEYLERSVINVIKRVQ